MCCVYFKVVFCVSQIFFITFRMIYPSLKANEKVIDISAVHNGQNTHVDIPEGTELKIVRESDSPFGPGYFCEFTLNGQRYTGVLILKADIGPDNMFSRMPPGQVGGKKRRRPSRKINKHRRRKTRRT